MTAAVQTVLCATDFSKHSGPVIEAATGLAEGFGARLIVFHAVADPRNAAAGPTASLEKQRQEAKARIEKAMGRGSTNWAAVVRFGEPVDEIDRYVRENDVGLVVAASYGLPGWKRFLMGTVVEALARTVTCPLLVVRSTGAHRHAPAPEKILQNILICCDLEESGSVFWTYALLFAQRFGAHLHFIHSIESPMERQLIDLSSGPYPEIQQKLQERLLQELENLIPEKVRDNAEVTAGVLTGHPGESMSAYAAAHAADLIMVGARRKNRLGKYLIGSTTEALLRNSPCHVLVLPMAAEGGK